MKIFHTDKNGNNRGFVFMIFIIFFIILNFVQCFKSDTKKSQGGISNFGVKKNPNYRKDCLVKEKCRECSFEELKNYFECQPTGYKLIKHCRYFDDTKLADEEYFNEPCIDNIKINSVYYFLIICIFIGVLSFYFRKSHKSMILSQTLQKLTILRKKA
jgi:hypothetical protein